MSIPYTPPKYGETAFNCPHCQAYANQEWKAPPSFLSTLLSSTEKADLRKVPSNNLNCAFCARCKDYSLWHFKKMIYPNHSGVILPNPDLSEGIQSLYLEAASIVNKSPRAAAALLRLCVDTLCKELLGNEATNKLNDNIAKLVKKGIKPEIQKALDSLRVTGNNAVHPGEISFEDNDAMAQGLFKLINFIAKEMITDPKEVDQFYKSLPETAIAQIEKRDKAS